MKTLHTYRTMSSSDTIVKRAEARTIDTAFCLYLDFVNAIAGKSDAGEYVSNLADEGWKDSSLDLERVQARLLVPELAKLLLALRFELIRGDNDMELEYNESTSMVVSYSLFCFLVRQQALRVRDNRAGHSYIIPDSKMQEQRQVNDLLCQGVPSEVLEDAIRSDKSFRLETENERAARENSYTPRITKLAQEQQRAGSSGRASRGAPVEDILIHRGKRAQANLAEARKRIQHVEKKICTFNPRIYPPPPELAHIKKRIDDSPSEGGTGGTGTTVPGAGAGVVPSISKVIPKPKGKTVPMNEKIDTHKDKVAPSVAAGEKEEGSNSQAAKEEKAGDQKKSEIDEKEYTNPRFVSSNHRAPPPPPLPVEIMANPTGAVLSSAEKDKQRTVARQLALELFDSSPRDPLKST